MFEITTDNDSNLAHGCFPVPLPALPDVPVLGHRCQLPAAALPIPSGWHTLYVNLLQCVSEVELWLTGEKNCPWVCLLRYMRIVALSCWVCLFACW